jgi:CTP synthase (UTP-ammonia lyase)
MKPLRIGLIGDFNLQVPAHRAIPRALALAAEKLGHAHLETAWIPTASLQHGAGPPLSSFHAFWCTPGSPYASMEGALRAIQFAREKSLPFLGTCGGYQHALIEYARHVLRLHEADHAESNRSAVFPLINRLACPLVDKEDPVRLAPGSRLHQIYGVSEIREPFNCKFGLQQTQESWFAKQPLHFTGRDRAGEARAFELTGHPFYIGTLYQPERTALHGHHHPLITAYVQAIIALHPA